MTYKNLDRLDEIRLDQFRVPCIIGIYDHEWQEPQPLDIQLTLFIDSRLAASSCKLENTVDYDSLAHEVKFILEHSHFGLLETAADAIVHYIFNRSDSPNAPEIQKVELKLTKPNALSIAVPSVKIIRSNSEVSKPFAKQETKSLYVAENYSLQEISLAPESPIELQSEKFSNNVVFFPRSGSLFLNQAPWLKGKILDTRDEEYRSNLNHEVSASEASMILSICPQNRYQN